MLIHSFPKIGNNLLAVRKRAGLTQMEVAEIAGLSNRTYADIERGTVNMRVETLLKTCDALSITPNEILTQETALPSVKQEEILGRLNACSEKNKDTAFRLLDTYLHSIL